MRRGDNKQGACNTQGGDGRASRQRIVNSIGPQQGRGARGGEAAARANAACAQTPQSFLQQVQTAGSHSQLPAHSQPSLHLGQAHALGQQVQEGPHWQSSPHAQASLHTGQSVICGGARGRAGLAAGGERRRRVS